MEKIEDLLGEEIKNQIESISSLNPGSVERSKAIDDLTKLYKLRIEETKNNSELDEKRERRLMEKEQYDDGLLDREYEAKFKREQLSEQVKDRYIRLGTAAAELILPLIFYAVWMRRGFKFEKDGTYTSTTFRGLFSRFKPTKK